MKSVVLVGMMGAGKTAVGAQLARLLAVPFLDSDEQIEKAAARRIAEIFERDGEAFFRQKETQVLRRLLDGPAAVISTGGGAFVSDENRAMVAARGVSVWLKADIDLLWQRVRHKTTRPLLRSPNPRETLRALLDVREPFYAKASIVIEARAEHTVDDTAARLLDVLAAQSDVMATGPALRGRA